VDRDDGRRSDWDGCKPGTPMSHHTDQYQTLKNKVPDGQPAGVLGNDGPYAAHAELFTGRMGR